MTSPTKAQRLEAVFSFMLGDVSREQFRCTWCHRYFPRPHRLGRMPRSCDEHKHLVKAHRENLRRKEGKREYPQCCLDAPGRVCEQHQQYRRFKRHWHHVAISASDSEFLSSITEGGQLDGFHII